MRPFIVKEASWKGEADLTYAWGAALKPQILGVAAVGPGYDHSAVPERAPLVRTREDGAFYSRSWELALAGQPAERPRIAVVETWNELHEGTEIAPTIEHGRKYIELTRRYADLWHAGSQISSLVLARAGCAEAAIAVARDAPEPERHAAEELRCFLSEIAGAEFRLEILDRPAPNGESGIRIGAAACEGIITPEEIARVGAEGYLLRSRGGALAIAGGVPRGTLYGVYSFLEDELGCRWFTPEVSCIPRRELVELRPLDRVFVPRLEYRATDYPNSRDGDWAGSSGSRSVARPRAPAAASEHLV